MVIFRLSLLILVLAFAVSRCGDKAAVYTPNSSTSPGTTPTPTPTPSPTTTPTTTPVATTAQPLTLSLTTVYDTTSYSNQLDFAETGTTTCSATAGTPVTTCTVTVPEGRLYFSKMIFSFSWLWTQCKLLNFQPYYYRGSTANNYVPPALTPSITDCTATPTPAACWGGAAPVMVSGFPSYRSLIFFPNETDPVDPLTQSQTLNSAYSYSYGSNRLSVNDMPAGKVNTSYTAAQMGGQGDAYVAGSYVNYSLTCRDDWYDPETYKLNIFIKDQDDDPTGTQTEDDFYTWKELP